MQLNRRRFLNTLALAGAGLTSSPWSWAGDLPRDWRVTRITGFELVSRRAKIAGKNSRLDVHGDQGRDRMVRFETSAGVEGLGNCWLGEKELAPLLGRDPFGYFDLEKRRAADLFANGTMPMWDLAGKALGQPVFQLLGGQGPKTVPVYDGSIYFADLLPQYADQWEHRFREEIDLGLSRGHRAFKIKVGRGSKWMDRTEGNQRDLEVLRVIRRHAGPEILLGVDANNGFDLAGAKQFLLQAGELNLAFVEEMFPETVEDCLALKQFMAANGWMTLLADGESQGNVQVFEPFVRARAIDIYQGDMNRFGFEGILAEATLAAEQHLQVAPHNWGSLVGFYMQLHVGRAITNFYRAENDPLDTVILLGEGYVIRDGRATVPETPGFGLTLNRQRFDQEVKPRFDLRV